MNWELTQSRERKITSTRRPPDYLVGRKFPRPNIRELLNWQASCTRQCDDGFIFNFIKISLDTNEFRQLHRVMQVRREIDRRHVKRRSFSPCDRSSRIFEACFRFHDGVSWPTIRSSDIFMPWRSNWFRTLAANSTNTRCELLKSRVNKRIPRANNAPRIPDPMLKGKCGRVKPLTGMKLDLRRTLRLSIGSRGYLATVNKRACVARDSFKLLGITLRRFSSTFFNKSWCLVSSIMVFIILLVLIVI